MDKEKLIDKIKNLQSLTNDEKADLLGLLRSFKKYGLVWEEKLEEVEERLREEIPVLTEVKERAIISDSADAPNHILIEGDNLEALTTLSYTHEGAIDIIYIDPPYNTGKKDFIYNDKFVDAEDEYRHSKWLSFMSKRLRIAKRLLSDKGVIFISIDDNEQAQLKLLCDEIFGISNFLGQLILKTATDNNPSQINTEHEYMLCYCSIKSNQGNWQRQSVAAKSIICKYKELLEIHKDLAEVQSDLRKWIRANKSMLPQVSHYNNVDNKGVYSSSSNSSNPHPGGYTYDILHPITHKPCPKPSNGWRWPESTFLQYDSIGEIEWGKDETTQPHVKKRIETSTEYLRTLIYEDNRGTTKELTEMFDGKKVFDNPKPHSVISRIIDFSSDKNSTILDFFAGSGTTLHATMQLNAEDGGNRRCILVTNNENGICENVTYLRNKKVIEGYTTPKGEGVAGLTNNTLRYYRTKFLPRERSPRNMRALVSLATDLLCIKEDLYTEQKMF
ncbi:MAG: site-specific DNA-methyltransferase, partial [Alphaproteobacteria bacterium]|nr:site-specific DNA-methyltransferase [Alphaproteobacteria bacterium]